MESSTTTRRLPRMASGSELSFSFTPRCRRAGVGSMNVRPMYRFLINPSPKGMPESSANPWAAENPVSGMGMTRSASAGDSAASLRPISLLVAWTLRPYIRESARARYTNSNRQVGVRGGGPSTAGDPDQLRGIDEVAVVAERQPPPAVGLERGLGVVPGGRARRGIAGVPDAEVPLERGQGPFVEDLGHQPEL